MTTDDFKEQLNELLKDAVILAETREKLRKLLGEAVESADIEFYISHRQGTDPLTEEEKTKVKEIVKRKAIKMVKEYFGEIEEEEEKTEEPHDRGTSQGKMTEEEREY